MFGNCAPLAIDLDTATRAAIMAATDDHLAIHMPLEERLANARRASAPASSATDHRRLAGMRRMATGYNYAYWGDRGDWAAAVEQSRDSDALDRSNFRVIAADMRERFPAGVATETANHWAVGWVESLLVAPGNVAAIVAARLWIARLNDYPIADEDDFAQLEYDEAPQCPDCGQRHYLPTGEYDETRYFRHCAHCWIRREMRVRTHRPGATHATPLWRFYRHGVTAYGQRRAGIPAYRPTA